MEVEGCSTPGVTREAYAQFVKNFLPEPQVDEDWAEEEWDWKGASFPSGTKARGFGQWYDAQAYLHGKKNAFLPRRSGNALLSH